MQQVNAFLLEKFFKDTNMYKAFQEKKVIYSWEKIVGLEIAKRTLVKSFQNGVLYINVANSSWTHHLSMLKIEIIEKIKHNFKVIVKDIVFRTGDILEKKVFLEEKSKYEEKREKVISLLKKKDVKIEKNHLFKIEESIKEIKNKKLKTIFQNILLKNYQLQKIREIVYNKRCFICNDFCDDEEEICFHCQRKKKKENYYKVKKLLFELPFLKFSECEKMLLCDFNDYNLAKKELIDEFIFLYKNEEKNYYLDNIIMLLYSQKILEENEKLRNSVKRHYINYFLYKTKEKIKN